MKPQPITTTTTIWFTKHIIYGLAMVALCSVGADRAKAEVLYVTTPNGGPEILTADTNTNVVTPVFNTVGTPDSLLFDTNGNIIYTNLGFGEVRSYNPTTHLDTSLAGGFNDPADLALAPGGASVFMSDFGGGKIYQINLSNNAVSTLGTYGGNPQGLAFDGTGRLFANLGTRSNGPTSFLAEINPVTGAIINQTTALVAADGLTYDPFSGKLYDTSTYGTGIYEIDPSTLGVMVLPNTAGIDFDGITTDSAGNLYIANSGNRVYQYDLTTQTLTPRTPVSGLDDLAPASGLGAPTPEPGTLVTFGTAILGLGGFVRTRLGR